MANEFKVRKGLIVHGSGSTILDVRGSQGQLFSITDSLSGSLFGVSDISGIPIFEVFSDDTIKLGTHGSEAIIVSGSTATVSGSFSGSYAGDGSALTGLSSGAVTTFTNGSNDRVLTATGAAGINGESNLTFDGSVLNIAGNLSFSGAARDILIIDNDATALEVKEGSNLYMRFNTANGAENILLHKNTSFSGQVTMPQTATTIGGGNLGNATLLIGSTSAGIGIDTNEIVSKGDHLYIGAATNDKNIIFRTDASSAVLTLDSSQNAKFEGRVGIGVDPASGVELHVDGEIRVDSTSGVATRKIRSGYFSSTTDIAVQSGVSGSVLLQNGNNTVLTLSGSNQEAQFTGNVGSEGFLIGSSVLETYQDFNSKPVTANSGLFSIGGSGLAEGYSRNISIWTTTQGVYRSWVGTNLRFDGTNYKRAVNAQNNNWGNIAGMLFWGNSAATGKAIEFIIDPPENASGGGTDTTIGTSLPSAFTALTINNDLSATFAGSVSSTTLVPSSHIFLGATKYLYFDGGGNTHIRESSADTLQITTGGTVTAEFAGTGLTLRNTIFNGNISTATDSTFDIGTSTARFANVYADSFNASAGSSFAGNVTIQHANTPQLEIIDTTNDVELRFRAANNYVFIEADQDDNAASTRMVFRVDNVEMFRLTGTSVNSYATNFNLHGLNNSGNPVINMIANDSDLVAGDDLGVINFKGNDVGSSRTSGKIIVEADGAWDATAMPTRLQIQLGDTAGNINQVFKITNDKKVSLSGELNGVTDLYAHRFFDSQDSTYYLDPANTSTSLKVAGVIAMESNKSVSWSGGSIRAEGNIVKITATSHINPQNIVSITSGGTAAPSGVNGLHLMFDTSGNTAYIVANQNGTSNRPLVLQASAFTFNNGASTFNSNVTVSGGNLSITGDGSNAATLTESATGDFTIAAVDDIRLDAGGNDIVLRGASSAEFARLSNDGQHFEIKNITENKDILFKGNDGNGTSGVNITALKLDMSAAGEGIFHNNIRVPGQITQAGSEINSIDLVDHGGYAWFRNSNNRWVFQGGTGGDDWTQSFHLRLESVGSGFNDKWALLGQQQNNGSSGGKYRGVRIVKSTGSSTVVDGDFQAGSTTVSDLTVTGNLNITGDLNTTSVTDLDVTDKTITVGVGQTAAASGESGLLVDGPTTKPSILWDQNNTQWDINYAINVADQVKVTSANTATLILRGDSGNSGDTGQLDSTIKMLHDDGTHGILMETKNYAGKQSFEIKSLSAGTTSSRFLIHEDNYFNFSGNVDVTGSIKANIASPATYFTGGSNNSNLLTIATNGGNEDKHTFNINSTSGEYEFDLGTVTKLHINETTADFSTNVIADTDLKVNAPDDGGAPAMTARINLHGYEGRGAGIKIRDSVNSASGASNREWFVGSGYQQSGFNIGYAADGSQSSYVAQNKFALSTNGEATFYGALNIPNFIRHVDDSDTYFGFGLDDQFSIYAAGNHKVQIHSAGGNLYGNYFVQGNFDVSGKIEVGDSHFIGDDADDNLLISSSASENIIINGAGRVILQDGGASKFETTSTGVKVTNTIQSTNELNLDSPGDITIDAGGGDIILSDDGVITGTISLNNEHLDIRSRISNRDIRFKGSDDGTEITAMTIDMSAAGRVGIGTSTPAEKLHVYNAGTSMIRVDSDSTSPYKAGIEFIRSNVNGGRIYNDGGAVQVKIESDFGYDASNPTRGGFMFKTAPVSSGTLVDAVRIDARGFVGIGLVTPTSTLHVSGTNDVVTIEGSGSTIFEVEGSQGQLFSVTDTLSGSLFSVSDISGMPILEVDSADRVTMGSFGSDTLVVTGSQVLVSTSTLSTVSGVSLSVSGSIQLANDSSFIYDNGGQNIIGVNGTTVTLGSTGNTSVTLPYSTLQIGTINGTNTDHDKFLVSHSGTVKFVSGSQLRSQIGAQASGNYVNDGGGSANAIAVWSNGTTISGSSNFIMSGGHLSFAGGATCISGSDTELVLNSQGDDINVKIQGFGDTSYIFVGENNIGINQNSPSTKLHIGDGGTGTVDAAYSLAIEGDGIDGVQILSANNQEGRIVFGDAEDNDIGQIKYDHSANQMKFRTNGGDHLFINSSGNVGIGGTPGAKLDVNAGATNTVALFESTDDKAFIRLKDNDTDNYLITKDNQFFIGNGSGDYTKFNVNTSTGNVAIGASFVVPTSGITPKLQVVGGITHTRLRRKPDAYSNQTVASGGIDHAAKFVKFDVSDASSNDLTAVYTVLAEENSNTGAYARILVRIRKTTDSEEMGIASVSILDMSSNVSDFGGSSNTSTSPILAEDSFILRVEGDNDIQLWIKKKAQFGLVQLFEDSIVYEDNIEGDTTENATITYYTDASWQEPPAEGSGGSCITYMANTRMTHQFAFFTNTTSTRYLSLYSGFLSGVASYNQRLVIPKPGRLVGMSIQANASRSNNTLRVFDADNPTSYSQITSFSFNVTANRNTWIPMNVGMHMNGTSGDDNAIVFGINCSSSTSTNWNAVAVFQL